MAKRTRKVLVRSVRGMPPEDNFEPEGLYTFDVAVFANPYDGSLLRSVALKVEPGPVEYFGYDDNGTPDDESDDGYLYYIRWYRLASGRDSSYGEIWLYDPDFEKVQSWWVPSLYCIEHESPDGLRATPEGLLHGVILRVPVSVMEKAGTYRFVLHFYDDYADSYKNHQVEAALERNATDKPFFADNYDNHDDTTPSAKEAARIQRQTPVGKGYLSFAHTNEEDPSKAMRRVLLRSNIVFIVNHGAPGEIQIGSDWSKRWVASNSPNPNAIPAIEGFSFINVRFIAFLGCNTANTSPNHGNLLTASVNSGATTAMGFSDYIAFNYDPPQGNARAPYIWTDHFWSAAMGWLDMHPPDGQWDSPMTVAEAARFAAAQLDVIFPPSPQWSHGYWSYKFEGRSDLVLAPAPGH